VRINNLYFVASLLVFSLISTAGCVYTREEDWPAGLPHGDIILPNVEDPDTPGAYFDFSTGSILYGDQGRQEGDIYLDYTFVTGNAALNVALASTQTDTILYDTTAPSWGQGWNEPQSETSPAREPVRQHMNYWVRTAEGHYGKLRIVDKESNADVTSYNFIKFQWVYQPDGSNELHAIEGASEAGTDESTGS